MKLMHTFGRSVAAIVIGLVAVSAQAKSEDHGWGGATGYYTFSIPGKSPLSPVAPNRNSFSALGGGEFRIALPGHFAAWGPASYQGTTRAIAAPAPEPETLAMMMVGLVGVGAAALRRRRQR